MAADQPFMQFDRLAFRCYYPQEIQQLSVLEIKETKTFDDIGYPIRGGLYDPALGPAERAYCETCGLNALECPGHAGHIRLCVPVFNPVLFPFTLNLMKGSCVNCHRMTCNTHSIAAESLLYDLRRIETGEIGMAIEIAQRIKQAIAQAQDNGQ
ncbi:Protein RPOA-1 a, partial [Aphelenchoides avenae]